MNEKCAVSHIYFYLVYSRVVVKTDDANLVLIKLRWRKSRNPLSFVKSVNELKIRV